LSRAKSIFSQPFSTLGTSLAEIPFDGLRSTVGPLLDPTPIVIKNVTREEYADA